MVESTLVNFATSPEGGAVLAALAAVATGIIRLTFRVGAKFKELELKDLKVQEELHLLKETLEALIKYEQEHYCLTQEEARKFLHYHMGDTGTILHT